MRDFSGANNPRWKGGIKIHAYGYILVASPNHPHKDKQGYVRKHRLVMEEHLGRLLESTEDIHHINEDKTDNRIENLELFQSRSEHIKKYHTTAGEKTRFRRGQIPHNKYLTERHCKSCNELFQPTSNISKYCSKQCYWNTKKGVLPPQLIRSV